MSAFRGICASAITPHRGEGHEADVGAMLDLIDFLVRGGAQSVCLLGPEGEFLNLSFSDRIRLVHLGVKRSRVPIMASVSHSTLDGALELAGAAFDSDASAVLAMPPYFFPYDQADILEFYSRLAAGISRRMPLFIHQAPRFTSRIETGTLRALLATGRFAGVADASGDPGHFAELARLRQEIPFTLLQANDRMNPGEADGVLSGAACAIPEMFVQNCRAQIQDFVDWAERFPTPVAVKTALALRRVKTGPMSLPLPPAKAAMLEEFRNWFRRFLHVP